MLVVAHRTCPRHAPENSIEGILCAAELGADIVEVDVRRTRDGIPILMHDRTPRRTARSRIPVIALPFARARQLRLHGSNEPVPTFADALDALPDGLSLAIDIKHASATPAVIAVVRARGLESRVLLWSEHPAAVRIAVQEAPEIEASLLRDAMSAGAVRRFLDDAVGLGARGISAHWDVITEKFLDTAHARGLRVYSWCEELDRHAEKLSLPLDAVVTEWPAEARATLEAPPARS